MVLIKLSVWQRLFFAHLDRASFLLVGEVGVKEGE
jgi:hypothetical protein